MRLGIWKLRAFLDTCPEPCLLRDLSFAHMPPTFLSQRLIPFLTPSRFSKLTSLSLTSLGQDQCDAFFQQLKTLPVTSLSISNLDLRTPRPISHYFSSLSELRLERVWGLHTRSPLELAQILGHLTVFHESGYYTLPSYFQSQSLLSRYFRPSSSAQLLTQVPNLQEIILSQYFMRGFRHHAVGPFLEAVYQNLLSIRKIVFEFRTAQAHPSVPGF